MPPWCAQGQCYFTLTLESHKIRIVDVKFDGLIMSATTDYDGIYVRVNYCMVLKSIFVI